MSYSGQDKFRIHAELFVEGKPKHGEYGDDPMTDYVVYSSSMRCEGAIEFSCRPTQLEAYLKMIFRTEDPMMKQTKGLLPNTHSSMMGRTAQTAVTTPGGPRRNYFLTRDPIYKEPEGSTKDLVVGIGKEVLGRDPGPGVELLGDLIDDIITPKRRQF